MKAWLVYVNKRYTDMVYFDSDMSRTEVLLALQHDYLGEIEVYA